MNRKQMDAVIAAGGSVLYQGRIITRAADLPSAAALAAGDPQQEAQAAADLQDRIAALEAELAKLQPKPESKKESK